MILRDKSQFVQRLSLTTVLKTELNPGTQQSYAHLPEQQALLNQSIMDSQVCARMGCKLQWAVSHLIIFRSKFIGMHRIKIPTVSTCFTAKYKRMKKGLLEICEH